MTDIAQRVFRAGFPLWEAKYPLRVVVTDDDILRGVKGNPEQCVLACALRRQFGMEAYIEVFRSVAYVFLGDHYERFMLPARTTRVVEHWDRTGEWTARDLVFTPPTKGRTLAARAELNKRRRPASPDPKRQRSHAPRVLIRGSAEYLAAI